MLAETKRNKIFFLIFKLSIVLRFRYKLYKDRFWFDGMYTYVEKKCKECLGCVQKRKANTSHTALQPIPAASGIMSRVHIDITGGFVDVTTKNVSILLFLIVFFVRTKGLENISFSVCVH